MTKQYNVITDDRGNKTIWYEENGFRVSFGADPANADYQEYLNPVEHLTEISTPEQSGTL